MVIKLERPRTWRRPVLFASPGVEPSAVQVAQSLAAAGLLRKWLVPIAVENGTSAGPLTRAAFTAFPRLRKLLSARMVPRSVAPFVQCFPVHEFARIALVRSGLSPMAAHHAWYRAELSFDRYVARRWAGWTPVLYGVEHSTVFAFRRHKQEDGANWLWQVIAHHQTIERVLEDEYARFPGVRPTLQPHTGQPEHTNARKDEQIGLADLIVTNSEYVRRTFIEAGVPADRVTAAPTACPPALAEPPARATAGPLVFLNAGTLSIRKGLHLLLDAWRKLDAGPAAQLLLVGTPELPPYLLRDLPDNVVLRPRVPRSEMPRLFRDASVFVLPTLCEGRASVLLQALANGLPVITTPSSGCEDLIHDGRTGWLVPTQSVEALADRMQWFLDRRAELPALSAAALDAARHWQLQQFIERHAAAVQPYLARLARDWGA